MNLTKEFIWRLQMESSTPKLKNGQVTFAEHELFDFLEKYRKENEEKIRNQHDSEED